MVHAVQAVTILAQAEGAHEAKKGLIALIVVVVAILVFHGSIYTVVSLNTGWRFGYWITGASMGGLAMFLSVFWLMGPGLGPRGSEPRWIPVAASTDAIPQVEAKGRAFTATASYPGEPWAGAPKTDKFLVGEQDAMKTAISSCLTTTGKTLEGMPEGERRICEEAQALLPSDETTPKIDDVAVPTINDVLGLRFTTEAGSLLGQVQVTPVISDPRITGDSSGEKKQPIGRPFRMALVRDPGNVKVPSMYYFVGSLAFFAFHLFGLNRAERRKLSPVAA